MTDSGYLWNFPDEGVDDGPRRFIEMWDRFTFSVPRGISFPTHALCLVALTDNDESDPEPRIEFLALLRRGRISTSLNRTMTLEWFEPIDPLPVEELRQALPIRLQRHFSMGKNPRTTWAAALEALAELRPSIVGSLEKLRTALRPPGWAADSEAASTVVYERDAMWLAASLAGIERRHLTVRGAPAQPAPFLQGLPEARVREDAVIEHDARVFGDWDLIKRHQIGAVEFANRRGDRLTVINANRHPIESTLGVDLLYYTHSYDAFVLVQYKSLRKEDSGKFVYRPRSDSSLAKELARMQSARRGRTWTGDLAGYRLDSQPFYFKFCRNVTYEPMSQSMTKGMYLPLDYWDVLAASSELSGPRGGIVVSYDTVPRYLTNDAFVELVEDGWIGSRYGDSDEISVIVRASLDDGHSLLLATHTPYDH